MLREVGHAQELVHLPRILLNWYMSSSLWYAWVAGQKSVFHAYQTQMRAYLFQYGLDQECLVATCHVHRHVLRYLIICRRLC